MHGASVYLGCSSGELNQVWYFYNVKGNVVDGTYKAVETREFYCSLFGCFTDISGLLVTDSGCPKTGIKYLPK
jgi:ribonuclease T2